MAPPKRDSSEGQQRVFSYAEAAALLPEIRQITAAAYQNVEALAPEAALDQDAQEKVDRIVTEWTSTVVAYGAEVKGLWLVDFDNGSGYYCWRFPETSLQYYHSYHDGFDGRTFIQ